MFERSDVFGRSEREMILANPEMFTGQRWSGRRKWENEDLQVLIMLVIRAAVDSDTLNQCSLLKVTLRSEDEIVIEDDGVGLAVAPPSHVGSFNKAALTQLLGGYMPTGELTEEHYSQYGFLGHLARLLNVLSESLRIDTVRQDQTYTVLCSRGEIVEPLQKTDNDILTQGTRIRFEPDSDVFPRPIFNEDSLKVGLSELAGEFPQVTFEFTGLNHPA